MKKVCLLIFLLTSGSSVFSQDDDFTRGGYFGIGFGPCYPVGNFSSSNFDDTDAGFAVNGYQFTALDFGYRFVKNFGLTAAFKGANVPMNVQEIADIYAEEYGGQFTVESKRWNFGGLFAGPMVSAPSKRIDLDFKFMLGMIMAFSPEIEIRRDPEYVRQESATGVSFAFDAGATLRIHLTSSFSLTASADYMTARPVFNIEYSSQNGFDSETVYQRINTLSLSGGIAFRFFSK